MRNINFVCYNDDEENYHGLDHDRDHESNNREKTTKKTTLWKIAFLLLLFRYNYPHTVSRQKASDSGARVQSFIYYHTVPCNVLDYSSLLDYSNLD